MRHSCAKCTWAMKMMFLFISSLFSFQVLDYLSKQASHNQETGPILLIVA